MPARPQSLVDQGIRPPAPTPEFFAQIRNHETPGSRLTDFENFSMGYNYADMVHRMSDPDTVIISAVSVIHMLPLYRCLADAKGFALRTSLAPQEGWMIATFHRRKPMRNDDDEETGYDLNYIGR